jgi:hypothetical protein
LYGIVQNTTVQTGALDGDGQLLSGYAAFPSNGTGKITVTVRVGTSFISVDQARRNIDVEIPDRYSDVSSAVDSHPDGPQTLEHTARITRSAWAEKLDLFTLEGATEVQKEVFWTGVAHALQVDLWFYVDHVPLPDSFLYTSIPRSNMRKHHTILAMTAKCAKLAAENHIRDTLSGSVILLFIVLGLADAIY